jgi:hypothetical protein
VHPGLPSCGDCQKWQIEIPSGKVVKRGGQPQRRKRKPPCAECPKIKVAELPAGTIPGPHLAVELSDANRRCLDYHKEGVAVGWNGVPTDELVRRHAAMIGELERSVERVREQVQGSLLVTLAEQMKGSSVGRPHGKH